MNKILSTLLLALLVFIFSSCEKSKNLPAPHDCIDSNLIGNADECIEIYDPVFACDGVTYDNYCIADSSGITSYSIGEYYC